MNLIDVINKLRTKPVKKFAYGLLVLLIAVDFIIPRHDIHFFGDKIPGFWSLFGLVSCVLIIVVSKWLGQYWLVRDEDYYDK